MKVGVIAMRGATVATGTVSGTDVIIATAIAAATSTRTRLRRAATDGETANVTSASLANIPKLVAPRADSVAVTRSIALRIRSNRSSNNRRRRRSLKRPRRRKLQRADVLSAAIVEIVETAAGAEVVADAGAAAAEDAAVKAARKAAPRMPSLALKVRPTTRANHNRVQKRARKHNTASIWLRHVPSMQLNPRRRRHRSLSAASRQAMADTATRRRIRCGRAGRRLAAARGAAAVRRAARNSQPPARLKISLSNPSAASSSRSSTCSKPCAPP
jgi:hypothetical protein